MTKHLLSLTLYRSHFMTLDQWQQLRSGDKNALASIYNEHVDVLIKYGMKVCGDISVVEDCIQNLFITLWEKHASLGQTDSIRNYLLASLRRAIYKYHNKKVISQDPVEMRTEGVDAELSFEQLTINAEMDEERKARFKHALEKISSRQREVIYLRYYQDKDYDEICEIMGITYQGARNMLFKALKSLKDHMTILIFILLEWVTKW